MSYQGLISLVEWVGQKIIIETTQERVIRGKLISFDTRGSLTIDAAEEIAYFGGEYAIQPLGAMIVAGVDVALVGADEGQTLPGWPAAVSHIRATRAAARENANEDGAGEDDMWDFI